MSRFIEKDPKTKLYRHHSTLLVMPRSVRPEDKAMGIYDVNNKAQRSLNHPALKPMEAAVLELWDILPKPKNGDRFRWLFTDEVKELMGVRPSPFEMKYHNYTGAELRIFDKGQQEVNYALAALAQKGYLECNQDKGQRPSDLGLEWILNLYDGEGD